jgi:hypothetical protein
VACPAAFAISMPLLSSEPSMIPASTRFFGAAEQNQTDAQRTFFSFFPWSRKNEVTRCVKLKQFQQNKNRHQF